MNNKKNIQREKLDDDKQYCNSTNHLINWNPQLYKLSLHVYIAHIVIAMYVLVL